MHKQEYKTQMKNAINNRRLEIENAISTLNEKSDDVRARARLKLHELKDELNEVDKKLDRMAEVADDTWENIKEDLDEMWSQMTREFQNVQNETSLERINRP